MLFSEFNIGNQLFVLTLQFYDEINLFNPDHCLERADARGKNVAHDGQLGRRDPQTTGWPEQCQTLRILFTHSSNSLSLPSC